MAYQLPGAAIILADSDLVVTGAIGADGVEVGSDLLDHIVAVPREQAAEACRKVLAGGVFERESKSFRATADDLESGRRTVMVISPKERAEGESEGVVCAQWHVNGVPGAAHPSCRLYESMVENAVDTIFLLDSDGVIAFVNKRVEYYAGLSVEGLVGLHFAEVLHPDDVMRCAGVIAEMIAERKPVVDLEYRIPLPDRTTRYFVANGRIVEDGDRTMILGIGRDATESVTLKQTLSDLHSDLADRVNRLSMLERLAKAVNAERDVGKVLIACMREVAGLVDYDLAVVVLLKADAEAEIHPFGRNGVPQATSCLRLGADQMHGMGAIDGPVVFPDMGTLGPFHERPGTFDPKTGSGAAVPLMSMGRMFGLLKVWTSAAESYGEREIGILQSAAEHLSIAAYNAVLYETEQRRALEMTAHAREARHRVKNNLQMISGLLNMSLGSAEGGGKAVERCLRQISAIASVHDLLDPDNMSAKIRLQDCLSRIASSAIQATGRADAIELVLTGDDCLIAADAATAVGVIVNELVSNAVKHGFKDVAKGRLEVRVRHGETECSVEVIDDGVGLPRVFELPDVSNRASGLGLVAALAKHGLGGVLEIERAGRGTCARITVKGV